MSENARRRAFELFDQICDLPATEQTQALEKHCGDDAALRDMVERMLGHDALSGDDDLPPGTGAELIATQIFDETTSEMPTKIGRYRIIREIGHGGMGVVYEAEQAEPQRRVAFKVIRQGLRSREMVRRFQREAQLLGRLQHPGVAQIIEAGTDHSDHGKRPFYAMEFVEGLPIDLHADQHNLDINDRIELIARVCDAVQHAHQKGILHRDLKAANVLVATSATNKDGTHASGTMIDTIGQPKVLDFGIARLTDGTDFNTQHTVAGQILGSLACMSPEQLNGDRANVDTRADVYAIGVMLYRLLAGRMPHDLTGMSMPEAARTVAEKEPATLSTVDKSLRGDLSVITAKALERDIERRYASVALLGEDLRRVLRDEPITARRASTRYRLTKFARRNKAIAAAALLSVVALVMAVVVSTWFGINATVARKDAESALQVSTRSTYRAKIAAAAAALRSGDAQLAATFLDQAPEEYRGWEWHHINFELDRSIATGSCINRWGGEASKFLRGRFWFSNDEQFLFTIKSTLSLNYTVIEVIDAASLQPLTSWKIEQPEYCLGRFDGGNEFLIYDHESKFYIIRKSRDGSEIRRFRLEREMTTFVHSFDELPARIAPASIETQIDSILPNTQPPGSGARAPSGERWIPWNGQDARAWPLQPQVEPISYGDVVEGISNSAYSQDGSKVAITTLHRRLDFFDAASGTRLWGHANAHDDLPLAIAFSEDGKLLATGGQDLVIKLWDTTKGQNVGRLVGHQHAIAGLAFDKSGEFLFSGDAEVNKKWRLRDAFDPGVIVEFPSYLGELCINPAGSILVARVVPNNIIQAPTQDIRSFLLESQNVGGPYELPDNTGVIQRMVFLDDERLGVIATVHEGVKDDAFRIQKQHSSTTAHQLLIFRAETGTFIRSVDLGILKMGLAEVDKGELLIRGTPTLSVNLDTLKVMEVKEGIEGPHFAEVDEMLQWRDGSGKPLHTWSDIKPPIAYRVIDADRHRAFVATHEMKLYALDLDTGAQLAEIETKDRIRHLALLPDGSRLFGTDYSSTIQIWNTGNMELVAVLRGHKDSVRHLAVTPNGATLFSASDDFTVRAWNTGRN